MRTLRGLAVRGLFVGGLHWGRAARSVSPSIWLRSICSEGYVQYARSRGCDRSGHCFESGRDVADPERGRRRSRPGLVSIVPPIMAVLCPPFDCTRAQAVGYQRRKACGSHFVSPAEPNAEHFCCRTPPNAPKNAEQTRRGQPQTQSRAAKHPRRANEAQRHPTDTRTGAVSRGCFPARRGYLMRRSPEPRKRHQTDKQNGRRDGQPRKPDERGEATAANEAERTRQADATKRTNKRGKGPRQTQKRAKKTKRGTPGERPPPDYRSA